MEGPGSRFPPLLAAGLVSALPASASVPSAKNEKPAPITMTNAKLMEPNPAWKSE